MKKNINVHIYNGTINKDMMVNYVYTYEYGPDSQYPTIKTTPSGTVVISNSYGLSISEGYDKNRVFIGRTGWHSFVVLLAKTVKTISENLYEIFPDINKDEFDIDSRVLERFQTEKACSTAGITMVPAVWIAEGGGCYPAIRIMTVKGPMCVLPFEDCVTLSTVLNRIDPELYGIELTKIYAMFK